MTTNSARAPILGDGKVTLYTLKKTLGDALFLTTVAHEIRRRDPDRELEICTHWPELFHNNPDVGVVRGIREPAVPDGIEVTHPWPPPRGRHVLQTICEGLGIPGDEIEPRVYCYLTEDERKHAREMSPRNGRPLVVIHPFSGFFAARTKQWDFSNWKRLIELIPHEVETMRFSNSDEPATPSERPFHREIQTTDVRLMIALLELADVFIGHDSGIAHMATALGKPSVVIFTGYVPPDVFGYQQNTNLVPDLPYVPCWDGVGCPPCKGEICTRAIRPEQALEALLGILDGVGS